MTEKRFHNGQLIVKSGDITLEPADAIVNAASQGLNIAIAGVIAWRWIPQRYRARTIVGKRLRLAALRVDLGWREAAES